MDNAQNMRAARSKRIDLLSLSSATLLLIGFSSISVLASPGDLDTSFSSDGLVTTDIEPFDIARAVLLQTDGKIVVVGRSAPTSGSPMSDFSLVRYRSNGAPDSSFGSGGIVTTDFEGNSDSGLGATLQSDGKIVVVGDSFVAPTGNNRKFSIARYDLNGALDLTFGAGGKVTTDIGPDYDSAFGTVEQPDGKILVAGFSFNGSEFEFALTRYESSGALDTTFGTNGVVTTPDTGQAFDLALQPDQRIVVVGTLLARYNPNGSLDASFGVDGIAELGGVGRAIAIQTDGRIVVAGGGGVLSRYTGDGALDPSFGTGGVVPYSGVGNFWGVALTTDGEIVAAGQKASLLAVARYHADGTPDLAFGVAGASTADFDGTFSDAFDLAIQPDEKIVAAGRHFDSGDSDFAVARFEGGPCQDGDSCDDGSSCTVGDFCASGSCVPGSPLNCDDDNVCTVDSCNPATGCVNLPTAATDCRVPGKTLLVIKDYDDDSKDSLTWKWLKGQSTSQAEFGVPTGTASRYTICMYGGGTLLMEAVVHFDSAKWSQIGNKGYRFKDNLGTDDGIQKIVLKGSDHDRAKALVRGKGTSLPDPILPLPVPTTVQLINSETGICWEGTYEASSVKKNDSHLFKAKVPQN